MNLDGLRVAVTGAARDTGRLLAEAFAERGAQVFLTARDLTAAEHAADTITRRGPGQASAVHCDLAEPDSVRAFAARPRIGSDGEVGKWTVRGRA